MSFPRYPKYKDSGVDWMGEIPEHWEVLGINRLVQAGRRITYGIVQPGERDENGRFMVRGQDYSFGWAKPESVFKVSDAVEVPYRRARLMSGDLVITIVGAGVGNVAIVPEWLDGANITQTTARIAIDRTKAVPSFVAAVLQGPIGRRSVELYSKGAAQPGLNLEHVRVFPVTVPPLNEQTLIAGFLDRETGKIDTLIAEQRRLIELLQEKRQAVISHAVTKGLNPDAPMKDSGIEWLGQVPEHWEVKNIRHFAEVTRGKFTHRPRNDPAFYDGAYPFIQTGDVTGASKFITGYEQTLNDRGIAVSKQFPKGTLVMAIAANIGDVAILGFPAYFPDSIVGLVPKATADVMFMFYLMQAMKGPMLKAATISTQLNLNVEQICSITAVCPPLEEQRFIASYLDSTLDDMHGLEVEVDHAINLLQERRSAIISAAVTGQIDVRGLAPLEGVDA